MKKFFLITIMIFCLACNAENLYTISMLTNSRWINVDKKGNTEIIEFTQTILNTTIYFKNRKEPAHFQWSYYLTENYTEVFDKEFVGHSNQGNYITFYNDKLEDVFSKKIVKLNSDSLVLFSKAKQGYIGAANRIIIYTRIK